MLQASFAWPPGGGRPGLRELGGHRDYFGFDPTLLLAKEDSCATYNLKGVFL